MTASNGDDYAALQKNCRTARHKLRYVSPIASRRIAQSLSRLEPRFKQMHQLGENYEIRRRYQA